MESFSCTLWLLNPWNIWNFQGGKNKQQSEYWIANFLKLTSISRSFSFLPSPELISTTSALQPKFSSLMFLPWNPEWINPGRNRKGEQLMDYSKAIRPFHSLVSNPISFLTSGLQQVAAFPSSTSLRAEMPSFNGKDSSLSQLLMSLSSILLVSGAPVRGGSCAVRISPGSFSCDLFR